MRRPVSVLTLVLGGVLAVLVTMLFAVTPVNLPSPDGRNWGTATPKSATLNPSATFRLPNPRP